MIKEKKEKIQREIRSLVEKSGFKLLSIEIDNSLKTVEIIFKDDLDNIYTSKFAYESNEFVCKKTKKI